MLKFKNVNIILIIFFLICLLIHHFINISYFIFLIPFVAYFLVIFYGCYYIGSNFFINVVYSLKTDEKVIAISFDDGPDTVNTPQILKTLKEHGTYAAFFCIGNKIENNRDLFKQLNDEGHIIGNHSFSHSFWFDMLSSNKMTDDLQMMNTETLKVINREPKLFRPPYGVTNPNLAKAIKAVGFTPVGWSVRTMDTVMKDENKLLKKALKNLAPGAVYLFHDTSSATVSILPEFLKQVKLKGFAIIRLDKMLNLLAYA